ncbi:MAG: division/cell wall cluster transcriptional repressor MraZ [Cytophagales bacterium]|nr:division/cell wall cluster transcriptional repressor MraZ [Bernardetiaceae bacterium]MDW8211666.1 division/cell wall cluster transcriptional repressor MraZ [Cytophagales bacterium]
MPLFTGEYKCKLDAKGRLVLPAKLKASLPAEAAQSVILMRGFEPCIYLYSLPYWHAIAQRVVALNEFVEEYRNFQRNFFRGHSEVELDAAGRLLIPRIMLIHANIDKIVVVVGAGNRVEIWSPESYESTLIYQSQKFSQMAERIFGKEGSA